jgi:hypothetical protein
VTLVGAAIAGAAFAADSAAGGDALFATGGALVFLGPSAGYAYAGRWGYNAGSSAVRVGIPTAGILLGLFLLERDPDAFSGLNSANTAATAGLALGSVALLYDFLNIPRAVHPEKELRPIPRLRQALRSE